MIDDKYLKQVHLLLRIIPSIAKENCFAVHGGTAINLFIRNMPRLSVDIDLTYLPIENRANSLLHIKEALSRIRSNLNKTIQGVQIAQMDEGKEPKLFCSLKGSQIKVEVNTVIRGSISKPAVLPLNVDAQTYFNQFCEVAIVPIDQLYGGKICAALNRQHPRDLFDIKYLLESNQPLEKFKRGFIFCLLSSDRPIHETLHPHMINQQNALENQFRGMSKLSFSYNDYEKTRQTLIQSIKGMLSDDDKLFLLDFKKGIPQWENSEYKYFADFPSVKWKMENILRLIKDNPAKHKEELEQLKLVLFKFKA